MVILEIYDLRGQWDAFIDDLADDVELRAFLHDARRVVDEHEAEAAAWGLL